MSAIDEKALAAAKKAFDHAMETPNLIDCQTCAGRGFVHSDWCPRCAGGGVDLADGEENRPLSEAISAYLAALAPQQAAPMPGVDDLAYKFQNIMAKKLLVEDGEICGAGPASFDMARLALATLEAGTSEPVAWRVITNNTAMSFYIRREDAEQGAKNRLAYVRGCTSAVVEPLYPAPAPLAAAPSARKEP